MRSAASSSCEVMLPQRTRISPRRLAPSGGCSMSAMYSAMRLCGGSAFRKELGLERRFRDARAARVMAPTTEALLDFVGRVTTDLPLLDEANL